LPQLLCHLLLPLRYLFAFSPKYLEHIMSHSSKTEFIHQFDRRFFSRPRRTILVGLLALLTLQALMVAVIVSSESNKLDRARQLVEECPPGSLPSSIISKKRFGSCERLPIRFDTKV